MKKLFIPVLAALALLIVSCSEKFNTAAPYKNITVVYGYLDAADTAHYIRVQKAFLDQNKSALVMSQNPDSSFYAALDVKIKRINFSGGYFDSIHMNRVDLDQEGYPKQPGQFFKSPNYAYKFKGALDKNYIYRLFITNLTTGEVDSSDAPVIDDADPLAFYVDALDTTNHILMDFHDTTGDRAFTMYGQYITGNPNFAYTVKGMTYVNPAFIGQTIIRFNWVDSNSITRQTSNHYYDFDAGYFYPTTNGGMTIRLPDNVLFSAVATALGPAPANTYRLIGRCNISVYLSTVDYSNYVQTSLTQGTGLTGSEIEPIFTNISGANALGLYTSKGMRSGTLTMTTSTVSALMTTSLLASANIVGTAY